MPSYVWNHFKKEKDCYLCTICQKKFAKCKRGSTSALMRHLAVKHDVHTERKNTTLDSFVEKIQPDADLLKSLLVRLFAIGNLPYRLVDRNFFREFCSKCPVDYKFPSRNTLVRWTAKETESIDSRTSDVLRESLSLSLSMDSWSSPNFRVSLLCIMGHSISSDYVRKNIVIDCCPMEGSHTAVYLLELLRATVEKFGIDPSVITGVVADGAANVKLAVEKFQEDCPESIGFYSHCFCHRVHLLVNRVLSKSNEYTQIMDRVYSAIGSYRRSSKLQNCYRDACLTAKVPAHTLQRECNTRWNSHQITISRVLESLQPFQELLGRLNLDALGIEEVKLLELVCSVLTIFLELSLAGSRSSSVQGDIVASLHLAKPKIEAIHRQKSLSVEAKKLISFFLEEVQLEIIFHADKECHLLVDPRYAYHLGLKKESDWLRLENKFFDGYSHMMRNDQVDDETIPSKVGTTGSIWSGLNEFRRSKTL